jgi:hypothetical protein
MITKECHVSGCRSSISDTGKIRIVVFDNPKGLPGAASTSQLDSAVACSVRLPGPGHMGLHFLHFYHHLLFFTSYNIEKIGFKRFNSKISVSRSLFFPALLSC